MRSLAFVVTELGGETVTTGSWDVQSLLGRGRVAGGGGERATHGRLVCGYEVVSCRGQFELGFIGSRSREGQGGLIEGLETDGAFGREGGGSGVLELGDEVTAARTQTCLRSVGAWTWVAVRSEGLVIRSPLSNRELR